VLRLPAPYRGGGQWTAVGACGHSVNQLTSDNCQIRNFKPESRNLPFMFTVLTIFGTRPEAIKLAPVVRELERYPNCVRTAVCATAQHRGLLDQVLSVFQLRPNFDLDLMTAGQTFGRLVPPMLEKLDRVMECVQPNLVIVQGDTNTAFCGAL